MSSPEHHLLADSLGLYALGLLHGEERARFERHLAECAECANELRAMSGVVQSLPYAVPQIDPPAALRGRVLEAIGGARPLTAPAPQGPLRRQAPVVQWLALAAGVVLILSLGWYALDLRRRVDALQLQFADALARLDRSERQLAAATALAQGAQIRMAVLTAPDLRQVTLAGQPPAPRASARAFFSPSTGLVFAASDLPPLPAGRTYQVWLLRAQPEPPVSAGLLAPDASGRAAAQFDAPPNVPSPVGVAVSIEPEGGVPQPTGDIYLAGNTQ
ncbi:MAG TPA: anti-sigma factor [Vicinamibacterales bacterium]|jgi:anti-sigma-K factor RskA|nr:anti-sigma factor [Vicinamibacterales bacterium]